VVIGPFCLRYIERSKSPPGVTTSENSRIPTSRPGTIQPK
jgi:hypothetical protein